MISRKLLFASAVLFSAAIATTSPAQAWDKNWSGHHLVGHKSWVQNLTDEQKYELHRYLNYEHRQPCQSYREVPEGFKKCGCKIYYGSKDMKKSDKKLGRVIKSYTVYFDFDSARVTPTALNEIKKAVSDISDLSPNNVTVSGYTDSSGSSEYNKALSMRRANAVSDALTSRGVENRVLSKQAYGESNLAIRTNDGVKRAENRRVVIEFRK